MTISCYYHLKSLQHDTGISLQYGSQNLILLYWFVHHLLISSEMRLADKGVILTGPATVTLLLIRMADRDHKWSPGLIATAARLNGLIRQIFLPLSTGQIQRCRFFSFYLLGAAFYNVHNSWQHLLELMSRQDRSNGCQFKHTNVIIIIK
jgi:hypothetical protein